MDTYSALINQEKQSYIDRVAEMAGRFPLIYIYGAGKRARILFSFLAKRGVQVDGFCVTEKNNNPSTLFDIPVVPIHKLLARKDETLILIGAGGKQNSEISRTLDNRGYCNYILTPEHIEYFDSDRLSLRGRPVLEITPKIGCSVHCRFCPQDLLYKEYFIDKNRPSVMDFDAYKACVDKTPKDCIICFAGFVEPFLHPRAVDMIQYAASSGRQVSLYTTLVGMTKEDFAEIKNIPFYEVVLHTPDADEYANIPITEGYLALLDDVLNAKKPDGRPFVDYANCQGIPHPRVLEHTDGKLTVISELVDRAGNLKEEQVFENCEKKGRIVCDRSENFNHNILLPDGSVVLCCMDFGLRHVLGNLIECSYDDLFTGREMQYLKGTLQNEGKGDSICRKCSSAKEISVMKPGENE